MKYLKPHMAISIPAVHVLPIEVRMAVENKLVANSEVLGRDLVQKPASGAKLNRLSQREDEQEQEQMHDYLLTAKLDVIWDEI